MVIGAGIISKAGAIFLADFLPQEVKKLSVKHANNFLYALEIEDDDVELPYLETSKLRYVYKQTDDLYWILVTHTSSNLTSDVDLLGQFVCTIMEYGDAETNGSNLSEQQRELFYRHIWRPWDEDPQCPMCRRSSQLELWDHDFDLRLQFLRRIRDGHVPEADVEYFNGLIAEAWAISANLAQISKNNGLSDSDSFCSTDSDSISEETLIDGLRLSYRMKEIRLAADALQDPYERLVARRDLLAQSIFNPQAPIGSAPSFKEFDSIYQN